MEFIQFDLGICKRGQALEVTLNGSAANVRLMDSTNRTQYEKGNKYTFYGGFVEESPTQLIVPASGHWYVVVDMDGLPGKTEATIKILPGRVLV